MATNTRPASAAEAPASAMKSGCHSWTTTWSVTTTPLLRASVLWHVVDNKGRSSSSYRFLRSIVSRHTGDYRVILPATDKNMCPEGMERPDTIHTIDGHKQMYAFEVSRRNQVAPVRG